jgi:hypothetical protein
LRARKFGARFDQRCLERIDVVGEMISCRCHAQNAPQSR